MFQRIARRHADDSQEPEVAELAERGPGEQAPGAPDAPAVGMAAAGDAPDAPTERFEPVAPAADADAEQPTGFQPAVAAPEQPAASEPPGAGATPPPVRDLSSGAAPAPAPVAAAQPTPAGGAPAPAQPAPAQPAPVELTPRRPGFRARGRMRRRLRYLRKLRELQVRDLGGLVFDLRRFGRTRDDLVARKLDHLRACDDELRALERALGERRDLRDVREPGVGGTCPRCFAIYGSADRFCASCGAALGGAVQGPVQVPLAWSQAPPSAPTPPSEPGGTGPER